MQRKILGLFLFYTLITAGCGAQNATPTSSPDPVNNDSVDKSPFTGIPCAAPCWHGLEVGKSHEKDVLSTIPRLNFIDRKSVYFRVLPSMNTVDNPRVFGKGIVIYSNCINSEVRCLTIQVVEDILTEISIVLNYQINIGEAIDYLGNPNYVGFSEASGGPATCRVYLIWSEKSLVLESNIVDDLNGTEKNCPEVGDAGKISHDLLISEVRYMSAATIEELHSSSANEFFEFSGTLSD